MKFWKLLLLGAFIGLNNAAAVVVEIQATGDWEYYSGPDFDYHLVPYQVRFTYDTTLSPTSQAADQAVYPALSFSLTVYLAEGTWTHTTTAPHITVFNGTFSDTFQVASPSTPGAPAFLGDTVDFYGFDLTGPAATTFSNTSLPTEIAFEDFYFRKAKIYTGGFANNYISKDSTTLGPAAAVPEPLSWVLVAGLASWVAVAIRRRMMRSV